MSSRRLVLSLAAVAAAAAVGDASASSTFKSCRAELELGVQCTTVRVQLDRRTGVPGTVPLHVERIRTAAEPAQGALVLLSGGPGEGASAGTDDWVEAFEPALRSHDLIVVDQRGTGSSGPMTCPVTGAVESFTDVQREITACGAALGPRLPLFTVSDTVDDLEDVRAALGYERISLAGVSYGTRVALAYASRYPQRVDRLVLDSVVPLEGTEPYRLNSIGAVPRVLREACGARCGFTGDPGSDLAGLVARLSSGPLTGTVAGGDGRLRPARLGRVDLLSLLLTGDYMPEIRAHFPAAVHSALGGDPAPLLRLRDVVFGSSLLAAGSPFSDAVYFATTCLESRGAWNGIAGPVERSAAARAALESIPDERFAPFDRRTALAVSEIVTCRSWPSGTAVAPRFDAPLPDVPTLLLAGTADLRTPLEDAAAVARQLPRAQLVAVPGTGHAVTFHGIDCVGSAVARFFAGEQAERCPEVTPPAAAQPVPHPARAVSVLPATTLTVRDVLGQLQFTLLTKSAFSLKGLFIRAGGLRGGRYSATTRALTLERVTVVPGVAVSGRIEGRVDPFDGTIAGARGVLRVRAGARSGTLTLGDGRVTGRLGGRPVDAPLSLAG